MFIHDTNCEQLKAQKLNKPKIVPEGLNQGFFKDGGRIWFKKRPKHLFFS